MNAIRIAYPLLFALIGSVNAESFSRELVARIGAGQSGNYVVSPLSAQQALSMVAVGAAGETRSEMDRVLGFPDDVSLRDARIAEVMKTLAAIGRDGAVTLDVANRVWVEQQYRLLPSFRADIERLFSGGFETGDFRGNAESCRGVINAWVEERTRNRIQNLIPPGAVNPLTRLVLVNAVYFYGEWESRFDPTRTRREPFLNGVTGNHAELMRQTVSVPYREEDGLQVCALPYRDRRVSMVLLLPRAGGLDPLEQRVGREGFDRVAGELETRRVEVFLPRFKVESQFELGATLKDMGMRSAFDDSADFSGMTGTRDLYISRVIQKAFIEVNEKGTEAAAATGVIMLTRAAPRQDVPVIFRADRPFLYALRENSTGLILFAGRVSEPSR